MKKIVFIFCFLILLENFTFVFAAEKYVEKELFYLSGDQFAFRLGNWDFDDQDNLYVLDDKKGVLKWFDHTGKKIGEMNFIIENGIEYRLTVDNDGKVLIWNNQSSFSYLISNGKILSTFKSDFGLDKILLKDGVVYSEGSGKVFKDFKNVGGNFDTNRINDIKVVLSNITHDVKVTRNGKTYLLKSPADRANFHNFLGIDESGNIYAQFDIAMWGNGPLFNRDLKLTQIWYMCKYDKNFKLLKKFDGFFHLNRKTENLYTVKLKDGFTEFIKFEKIQ